MDNLTSDINFGKGILDKLEVKWEFGKPNLMILGKTVNLCSRTDCTLGNIIIIDKQQPKDHTISLYPRYNTYLEPKSVTYIPLKCRQKTEIKFNKDKDLLIKGNNSFEKRKLLQLDHINSNFSFGIWIVIFPSGFVKKM